MAKSLFKILVLSLFMIPVLTFAQKSSLKKGNVFFEAGKYRQALEHYKSYNKTIKDPQILIKRGICYLYSNLPDECLKDMSAAHLLKSMNNERFKYSALSYFAKSEYQEAAKFYKTYLNTLKRGTDEWKRTILEIKKCGYAKNKKYHSQLGFVENVGGNVNTVYDEFGPLQSPTKVGRYYFSSARSDSNGGLRNKKGLIDAIYGHYSSDIYYVDLMDGNWSTVLPFDHLLNTPKNDIIQDFSADGYVIYFLKSNDVNSYLLYSDTFAIDKNPSANPIAITSFLPFDAGKGDKDLQFFNDSLILFSSNRAGGYGGFDIYYSILRNNIWAPASNMGPKVNSSFNELSPFLIKNGNTIYFSSDKPETLGGYDLFKADFINGHWNEPINLLSPFNSPLNDIDIEVSADGTTAVFASNRISSIGGYDIYMAYLKDQIIGQLEFTDLPEFVAPITSVLTPDKSSSNIEIKKEVTQTKVKTPAKEFVSRPLFFNSDEDLLNNTNLTNLRRVADLMLIYPEIKILLQSNFLTEGRQEKDLYFSIKRAEKIAEQLVKFGIKSERILLQGLGSNFPLALPTINGIPSSLAEKVNKRIDMEFVFDINENLKVTRDLPNIAEQFRDTKWDLFFTKNKGLTFRVQFAEVTQMLNSEILNYYSDIIVEKQFNTVKYIYTTGNMSTYNEAKKIKDQLSIAYFTDSKIIPYYQGRRVFENEIEKLKEDFPQLEHWVLDKE